MKIRLYPPRLIHRFASILLIGLAILGRGVAADYAVGAKIEVQWAGDNKWYKAEILEFTEGQYKVRYEADGIIAYYKPERMRSLPGAAQPHPQPQPQAATMRQENGVTPNLSTPQTHLPAAKLPALPALKGKPGTIRGRAVLTDGRALPMFKVSAGGWAGEIHLGPSGTIPKLGQTEGVNGNYEITPTSAADRTKQIEDATVTTVYADALFSYQNRDYRLSMYPMDGKLDGPGEGKFSGKTGVGVVRDFVLKMHGPKRGYEINPPPTDTFTNNLRDPSNDAFYGGTMGLSVDLRQGGQSNVASIQDAKVTVTLTPTGTLMDGSRAQVVTRTMTIQDKASSGLFLYFRDIPLGDYTASVSMAAPGAAAFPLRLRVLGGEWQQSASVVFEPTTSGYTKTAQVLGTR